MVIREDNTALGFYTDKKGSVHVSVGSPGEKTTLIFPDRKALSGFINHLYTAKEIGFGSLRPIITQSGERKQDGELQPGDFVWFAESNRFTREAVILRSSRSGCLLRFHGGGGIRLSRSRLFRTEAEAIQSKHIPKKNHNRSPYDWESAI